MKSILFYGLWLLISPSLISQKPETKNYPRGYFRNPLDIPIRLAANFGELRSDHYHMGLDIRTNKRENLPVHASAGGYIARVRVEPEGFGQAVYVHHPNGLTTLYAHLNAFYPRLAAYVKRHQYEQETWPLSLEIPAGLFPVKQGELIAYSGNTGGSQGPHLHFEIRRTSDDTNLNPLLFGLPILDNTPPTIRLLAVYDMTKSIYEQVPQILPVHLAGTEYVPESELLPLFFSRVGFAIGAFDTQSGSSNPNGIFEARLYENDRLAAGFQMDEINYSDTRNINAHIDYKTRLSGGPFLQELFVLPGCQPSIYKQVSGNGSVDLRDEATHLIRIDVQDANGNHARLECRVRYQRGPAPSVAWPGKLFRPGMLDGFESADCAFYISEKSLYDSVHIPYQSSVSQDSGAVSATHTIGAFYIPVQDPILVRIRPIGGVPVAKYPKIVMRCISGAEDLVEKPEWQDGWASAKFRNFGLFQLLLDETPPQIRPVGFRPGSKLGKLARIRFIITDNLGVLRNFRAELDGKWLLFSNDKGRSFSYQLDEHCRAGSHQLKIAVEDEAGNYTERLFRFSR